MERALQAAATEALRKWAPRPTPTTPSSRTEPAAANGVAGAAVATLAGPEVEVEEDVLAGLKGSCEMLLTIVAFPTCGHCGDMLSKENEKSCNVVMCHCGHCVCYLCGRPVMKSSEMTNWDLAHEAFKKLHEERPATPPCCLPASPAAEGEHLTRRVAKAVDRLFASLPAEHQGAAYCVLEKLVEDLTK